ncbi:uncharacterized protein EV154DRAFT_421557 [Mucor mucedo]|uniref:uncharacterized protein n=1 Tax=Mucor mucedo TaxID=29922 RepID=UPI00221E3E10|nr:uncharacterized protein EV154DRAFT_421557 [Mucor mucedo]KAI7890765.1 hypothetical protein EV154DRAFT_421557 [Mucor mucedo]
MAEKLHNSWATIASRGNSKNIVRPLSVPNNVDSQFKLQSKVIYQSEHLDCLIRMQKATEIVKQALTPDLALFFIPASLIQHRTEAYKLIETQCGPVHGFRPISNYGSSLDGDHLIEVKFVNDSSFDKAIFTGITIKNTVIKGTYSIDCKMYKLAHVKISRLYIPDKEDFLEKLMKSLLVYGEVLQVKEYTCGGYFEGELSVILNTTTVYSDDDNAVFANEPLSNNLYLYE